MDRRHFLGSSMTAGSLFAAPQTGEKEAGGTGSTAYTVEVVVDRKRSGKPHKGKILAAIQPHCDDIPIFAGGTILKLLDEGYTGVALIQQLENRPTGEDGDVIAVGLDGSQYLS